MNKKLLITAGLVTAGLVCLFFIYNTIVNVSTHKGAPSIKIGDRSASLLNKAEKLMAQGDDDAAINILQDLITEYPHFSQAESAYFALASIYEKRKDLLKAKDLYQKMMEAFPDSKNILKMQELLDSVNTNILFSPIITQDSLVYEVEKGDTLSKIAKKFNTTVEFISKANNIRNDTVRIGQKLKISKARFSIVVDKSQNILTLKADGNILKTYRVSTGKDFSTPIGTFKITNKLKDPVWYTTGAVVPAGSPNNILGSRWLGISQPGYGMHGTTDPQSIGKQVTAGCVRMANSDIEELYSIVPEGTEVVIVD
ncbi:MAG: L,D-transpeptidase family protein [Candidatus Omnitrophica bacterium]|nr:L,D-transpeptidase family protein [Candidatus Omnitrophota bacterium]